MGGGGHGGTTYKGYTIANPARWHSVTGKGLCAVMWFWILYRAKQDGPVVLGWRHPWEGHGDHSDGHGHELLKNLQAIEEAWHNSVSRSVGRDNGGDSSELVMSKRVYKVLS